MRIPSRHIWSFESMAQRAASTTSVATSSAGAADMQGLQRTLQTPSGGMADRASSIMKYILSAAAVGYLYDRTSNHFFLSTTALHDGKVGFTSNKRLHTATLKAETYIDEYQQADADTQRAAKASNGGAVRLCGRNQFATMTDFRAATKTYLCHMVNTEAGHESLVKNLQCIKGERIDPHIIAKLEPEHVPKQFDLTQTAVYRKKDKYSLLGVANEETGSTGYTSRSLTRPLVNRGQQDFMAALISDKAGTPQQRMNTLKDLLENDAGLDKDTLFVACQALCTFRKVYVDDDNWGHNEKVINKALANYGWLHLPDTDTIEGSRPFQSPDMAMNILKRNTTIVGPILHKLDNYIQQSLLQKDPDTIRDLQHPAIEELLQQLPIAHFKLNEQGNGFEDCSGLGDSFTSLNVTSYINHARLMSGEQRLSPEDVHVLIACLYSIDDANSIRHSLSEIIRGCYVGAGYSLEDADKFYDRICQESSEAFYGGRQLHEAEKQWTNSMGRSLAKFLPGTKERSE